MSSEEKRTEYDPPLESISFEDYLSKYGSLTYRNRGVSMMPLLKQGRDLFTLVPKIVVLQVDHNKCCF